MGKVCAPSALYTNPDEDRAIFEIAATLERYEFVRDRQRPVHR